MRYFYTNTTRPLIFYNCGNLISRDGFLHQRRTLDCHVFILVLEGALHITQSGIPQTVSKGQYLFLRAGEEHFGHQRCTGNLSYMWVHFSSDTPWEEISTDRNPSTDVKLTTDRKPSAGRKLTIPRPTGFSFLLPEQGTPESIQRVSILFRQLLDYSRQESLYTDSLLTYSLSTLLMEVTQELIQDSQSQSCHISPIIHKIMEWTKSNCHRDISLPDIASQFCYNPEYLSSLFKKETGMNLVHYLNKSRVEVSKSLLCGSDVSIKEAAYSCGFRDEKYFMRIFKKYEGITPLQFKNAFHKKQVN